MTTALTPSVFEYGSLKTVFSFVGAKHAALYFDCVLPLDPYWFLAEFGGAPAPGTLTLDNDLRRRVEGAICPAFADDQATKRYIAESLSFSRELQECLGTIEIFDKHLVWDVLAHLDDSARSNLGQFLFELVDLTKFPTGGLRSDAEALALAYVHDVQLPRSGRVREIVARRFPVGGSSRWPVVLPSDLLGEGKASYEGTTVTLANLPLVDARRLSWDQILELRSDPEAQRKLRNLRLFLFENYEGKSRAFIEDDLGRRLDEYEATCRTQGLATFISALSLVVESKSLLATTACTIGAALLDRPLVAAGALASGVSIEVGRIVLDIAAKKNSFRSLSQHHSLAYLLDLKKAAGSV